MNDLPRSLKITTVWLLLLLVLFLAAQAWLRHQKSARFSASSGVIEIRRADDGHYHWPGALNGHSVEFLVDTGATASAIPAALAQELGLQRLGTMHSQTAGGEVAGDVVLADMSLQGGVRIDRIRLGALPRLSSPLLGMDVLGRLRLEQQAGVLRIDLSDLSR
jgi:aspartyl protease family protein